MAINCKHTKCAICGGFRLKSAYVGNTKLSDICSPKCQVATKDACSCKCEGYYHKGSNKKEMDAILNPKKKVVKKKKKPVNKSTLKYLVQNFEPEGITDEIGIFLGSRKINKQSFARFGDRNFIDKQLSRNWITNDPKGGKLDQLAMEYANEYYRNSLDESDIIQRMVDFIIDNPGGVKQYIKERVKQKQNELEAYNIRQDDEYYYVPDDFEFDYPEAPPEDLFINGIKNIKMKKLKKGSAEAKRFMAKIRSMKGKTTAKKSVGASDLSLSGWKKGSTKFVEAGEKRPKRNGVLVRRKKSGENKGSFAKFRTITGIGATDETKRLKQLATQSKSPLFKKVASILISDAKEYGSLKLLIEDVLQYGLQSGMVSELTYYKDTLAWYKKYKKEIAMMLRDTMSEMGVDSPGDIFGRNWDNDDPFADETKNQNLLAWYSFEETARNIGYSLGYEI